MGLLRWPSPSWWASSQIFGFTFSERYLIERILNGTSYITQTHLPTLAMSLTALLTLLLAKRYRPAWPSSMVAMVVTAALVAVQSRPRRHRHPGDHRLGAARLPDAGLSPGLIRELVLPALNLAMVSFVSMMLTARSFAAKNGYEIDADKGFRALGMANTAAAASRVLPSAGRIRAPRSTTPTAAKPAGLHHRRRRHRPGHLLPDGAAAIPTAALGVVLVMASLSLTDFRGLWALRLGPRRLRLALVTPSACSPWGHSGITLAVL
jgi:MFS superfamily sulfate permease-like transporter